MARKKHLKHHRRKSLDLISIVATVLLTLGYYLLSASFILDQISRIIQQTTIDTYATAVESLDNERIDSLFEECYDYNKRVYERQKVVPFTYLGEDETDEIYDSLMDLGANVQFGRITISKVGIDLPIYKGTTEENIRKGAGHVYGTSLPTGEESTHAVLSSHTGLRTAELFTRLDQLEIGDTFSISVLDKTFDYEVDQIKVVLPEDAYDYLQVEEGKTYVTLYTCTPYGVNTHRLLVRGYLTGEHHESYTGEKIARVVYLIEPAVKAGAMIVLPFIVLAIVHWIKEKRKQKKLDAQHKKKKLQSVVTDTENSGESAAGRKEET